MITEYKAVAVRRGESALSMLTHFLAAKWLLAKRNVNSLLSWIPLLFLLRLGRDPTFCILRSCHSILFVDPVLNTCKKRALIFLIYGSSF